MPEKFSAMIEKKNMTEGNITSVSIQKYNSTKSYVPALCSEKGGDTEESNNWGSSLLGQCTRRLRLPKASLPNQRVLILS